MKAIRSILRRLLPDQRAATAIEYGLIAALIAISIMTGLTALGGGTDGMWTKISSDVSDAM